MPLAKKAAFYPQLGPCVFVLTGFRGCCRSGALHSDASPTRIVVPALVLTLDSERSLQRSALLTQRAPVLLQREV